jgi:hypothetical protein
MLQVVEELVAEANTTIRDGKQLDAIALETAGGLLTLLPEAGDIEIVAEYRSPFYTLDIDAPVRVDPLSSETPPPPSPPPSPSPPPPPPEPAKILGLETPMAYAVFGGAGGGLLLLALFCCCRREAKEEEEEEENERQYYNTQPRYSPYQTQMMQRIQYYNNVQPGYRPLMQSR